MTGENAAKEMTMAFGWLRDFLPKTPWFSTDKSRRLPLVRRLTNCALNAKELESEYPTIAPLLQKCFDNGGEPFDIAYLLVMASERSSMDVASLLRRAGLSKKELRAMAKRIRTAADDIDAFNSPTLPGLWSHAIGNQLNEYAEEFKDLPAALRFYADAVADWPPTEWGGLGARESQNFEAVYLYLYLKKFGGGTWGDIDELFDFADSLGGKEPSFKEAARKRITRFAKKNARLYRGMKKDIDEYAVMNKALKRQGAKRTKYFPQVLDHILH